MFLHCGTFDLISAAVDGQPCANDNEWMNEIQETVRHRALWVWCVLCMGLWALGHTYLALPIFILRWWAQTNDDGVPLMEIMSPPGCSSPNGPLSASLRAAQLRRTLSEGYFGSPLHYADDVKRHAIANSGMGSPLLSASAVSSISDQLYRRSSFRAYGGAVGTTTSATTGGGAAGDLSFGSPTLSSPVLEPYESPPTPANAYQLNNSTMSHQTPLLSSRRHSTHHIGYSHVVGTQSSTNNGIEDSPDRGGRSLVDSRLLRRASGTNNITLTLAKQRSSSTGLIRTASGSASTTVVTSTTTATTTLSGNSTSASATAAALQAASIGVDTSISPDTSPRHEPNNNNTSGRSRVASADDLLTPLPLSNLDIQTAATTTTNATGATVVSPATPSSSSKRLSQHKIMRVSLTPMNGTGSATSEIASERHRVSASTIALSTPSASSPSVVPSSSYGGAVRPLTPQTQHQHQSAAALGAEKRYEDMTRGMMSSVVASSSTISSTNGVDHDMVSSITLPPGTAAAMLRSMSEPAWSSTTVNQLTGTSATSNGSSSFGLHQRRPPRPLAIPSSEPSSQINSPIQSQPASPSSSRNNNRPFSSLNVPLPMETKDVEGPTLSMSLGSMSMNRTTRPESPGQPTGAFENSGEYDTTMDDGLNGVENNNWWRWLTIVWWQQASVPQQQEAALKIINVTFHFIILITRIAAWAGIIRNLFSSSVSFDGSVTPSSSMPGTTPSLLRVERVLHLMLVMGSHLSGVAFSGLRSRTATGLLAKQAGVIGLTFMDVAIGMIFSLMLREFWTESFEDAPPTSVPTPLSSPRQRTDRLKWQQWIGWQLSSGVGAVAMLSIVFHFEVPIIVDILATICPAILASIMWSSGHWRPELVGSWFKNRPVRTFMLIIWYGILLILSLSLKPNLPRNVQWANIATVFRISLLNGYFGQAFIIVATLWNIYVIYSHHPELEVRTIGDLGDSEVATRLCRSEKCCQRRAVGRWPLKALALIPIAMITIPLLWRTNVNICTLQTGFEYPSSPYMSSWLSWLPFTSWSNNHNFYAPNGYHGYAGEPLLSTPSSYVSHASLVAAAHREQQTVLSSMGGNRMACLRAQMVVNDFVARRHNQGIFIHGARYPTFIQFVAPKNEGEPHAMSIKLMAVGGDKLETDEQFTQDFQLWTTPHFALDDQHHPYDADSTSQQTPWEYFWSLFSANDKRPHLINNPLVARYSSLTPYRLGSRSLLAVKYGIEPCTYNDTLDARDRRAHRMAKVTGRSTYLLEAARLRLQPGSDDVCLNLLIQEQRSGCKDPIEDDNTIWGGGWIKIAQLHIPAQEFWRVDQQKFCSQLRFTPWHTTAEHMPLGVTNRARRTMTTNLTRVEEAHRQLAYTIALGGTSNSDDSSNNKWWYEPHGDETFNGTLLTDPFEGAGDTLNYQYARYDEPYQNLPKLIAKLPQAEKFDPEEQRRFGVRIYEHIIGAAHPKGKEFDTWTSAQDYQYLLNPTSSGKPISYPKLRLVETWNTDIAFAWQFIRGPNPMMITVCKKLPSLLTMDNSTMSRMSQVIAPDTLEGLMAQSRLFVIDYVDLVDVITFADRVVYAPIVLMYLHREESGLRYLKPLAIQLARPTSLSIPEVFTPLDAPLVWQFAKMHAQAADSMMHQMVYHLGLTHLAMEPMIIAFHRQFHEKHPIFRLMKPHLKHTFAINNLGRDSLLKGHDASFDRFFAVGVNGSKQLMQDAWVKGDFKARMPYRDLQSRGFPRVTVPGSDDDILPGYYYRDDAYNIWDAMLRYFTQCVYQIYDTEEEMLRDRQIELFNREIHDPELADQKGAHQLTSRQELSEFLAATAFTMTAQHGAVGIGQYEFYSFIPNRPMLLTQPMPSDKSVLNDAYILSSLPNIHQSQQLITLMWFLSLSPVEAGGGQTGKHLLIDMTEAEASYQLPYRRLKAELNRLQTLIVQRNTEAIADQQSGRNPWITPYTYLLPSEIPSSLAI
jgi:hypothetical protein